ncbi:MAG: PAS domain-containing protein, partial [Limnochordia bacterium]
FTVDEWKEIEAQLSDPFASVERKETADQPATAEVSGGIELDVGVLTPEQINLMLTHLPIDITFVDANDEVRYFSLGPERIFERARAVIGRKVQFCHPPKSMGVVEQILEDFRSGRKDSADFWINMKGELVYIRYFAVRDENGVYQGTLEVTQNITEIQKITGEKRIYDYSN